MRKAYRLWLKNYLNIGKAFLVPIVVGFSPRFCHLPRRQRDFKIHARARHAIHLLRVFLFCFAKRSSNESESSWSEILSGPGSPTAPARRFAAGTRARGSRALPSFCALDRRPRFRDCCSLISLLSDLGFKSRGAFCRVATPTDSPNEPIK